MNPFTREDARKRAQMARNAAETWRGVVTEREVFETQYRDADAGHDAIAARRCTDVAIREVEFHLAQAEAYERIARGEEPYGEALASGGEE